MFFQSFLEPLALRPLLPDTTPIPVRLIGGGSGDFQASQTANRSTANRMDSSLSFVSRVTAASSTLGPRPSLARSHNFMKPANRNVQQESCRPLFLPKEDRVLAFAQASEVVIANCALQFPLLRQPALPLAEALLIAATIACLLRRELPRVVRSRLACG